MILDAISRATRLEALVCRNKVLAKEKESLKVAIATLSIELRHKKVRDYIHPSQSCPQLAPRQPERKQRPSPRELDSARQRSINERPT